MSTDFSIKPVGAPVAAPIVQHVSEAAQHAVATELPASQSVSAAGSVARASTNIQRAAFAESVAMPRRSAPSTCTTQLPCR